MKKEYLVFALLGVLLVSIFTTEAACPGGPGAGLVMGSGIGMGFGMGWVWIIAIVLIGTLFFVDRPSTRHEDAVDILDQRFARGELKEEEYLKKRQTLTTEV